MQKKIIQTTFLLFTFYHLMMAQAQDVSLVGTGGGMTKAGSVFLSYSFGEPFITYTQNTNTWISEGFQQTGKINGVTATSAIPENEMFSFFPNPTDSKLNVEWNDIPICDEIRIINILGQTLMIESISSEKNLVLNVSSLQPGLFWLSLLCENQQLINKPFIKL